MHLFLILLITTLLALLGGLGLLSADTTGAAATVGGGEGEVNVLLGVETDDERGDVDDLLADADVALTDQDTSVVDRLGETKLVDAGLETTLQEILDLKGKHVIELHAGLVEDTDTDQTANEGIALEETLGVLLVESKKLTVDGFMVSNCLCHKFIIFFPLQGADIPGSTTDLGQSQTDSPDLTLVAQAILADELKLRVPGVYGQSSNHNRLEQRQAHAQWPVNTDNRAASKGRRGTREVLE